MIFSINEFIDVIVMAVALGVIFSMLLKRNISPVQYKQTGFDWKLFKFAVLVSAPAIVLHELMHKFVAIAFGLEATLHAAYFWLAFGMILAMLNTGIIFFIPGYVSIGNGAVAPLANAAIAFAGPFANLVLWLGSSYMLKKTKNNKYISLLYLTKQINMLLFFFNMLPIPGLDGHKVLTGLLSGLF